MHDAFDLKLFTSVFVTLVVIMDPVGTIPVFLALTSGRSARARRRLAWQAVLVAVGVIAAFALFGQQILRYLGITVAALQGAGGLLLVLVALELLTGKQERRGRPGRQRRAGPVGYAVACRTRRDRRHDRVRPQRARV